MSSLTLQARWVVPVTGPPLEGGRITIREGRIESVSRTGTARTQDLGDVVLLPGFVNAHTHLELSLLHGRVPLNGSFVDWIRSLQGSLAEAGEDQHRDPFEAGWRESLSCGVTTLADIGCGRRAVEAWQRSPVSIAGFLEVLGIGPRRWQPHERSFDRVMRLVREITPAGPLLKVGLSPHAPYSTDAGIYTRAVLSGRPLCTHLAETREELQFLRDGTGPFRELLEEWGLWDGSFEPPGCSPVEYMARMQILDFPPAPPPLLVHLNYVSDGDLDLLAGTSCSVAWCPRTHRFFQHEPHRCREMLARGINVCIGTDSLASNQTLSVLDELRFVWHQFSSSAGAGWKPAPHQQLLAMGTMAGARALRLADQVGSLETGKQADLVVVPLENPRAADPLEDLLTSGQRPSAVYVRGREM